MSRKSLALPHQQLCNLHGLLGKTKGVRSICKTPMLWRLHGKSSTLIKQWEEEHRESYDTAGKGSSALTAALIRNLLSEVAVILGMHTGTLFNDFEKFFEQIDIEILIANAIEVDFP